MKTFKDLTFVDDEGIPFARLDFENGFGVGVEPLDSGKYSVLIYKDEVLIEDTDITKFSDNVNVSSQEEVSDIMIKLQTGDFMYAPFTNIAEEDKEDCTYFLTNNTDFFIKVTTVEDLFKAIRSLDFKYNDALLTLQQHSHNDKYFVGNISLKFYTPKYQKVKIEKLETEWRKYLKSIK